LHRCPAPSVAAFIRPLEIICFAPGALRAVTGFCYNYFVKHLWHCLFLTSLISVSFLIASCNNQAVKATLDEATPNEPVPAATMPDIRSCIVQIQIKTDQPQLGKSASYLIAGSGFVINSAGYIITAAHVIEKAEEYLSNVNSASKGLMAGFPSEKTLHLQDYQYSSSEYGFITIGFDIIDIDRFRDIALLKLNTPLDDAPYDTSHLPNVVPCRLSLITPETGTPVAVSGYPLQSPLLITQTGTVAGNTSFELRKVQDKWRSTDHFMADTPLNMGSSGDPAYPPDTGGTMASDNSFDLKKVQDRWRSIDYFLIDTIMNMGNSGGPAYLPDTGEIIGMALAVRTAPVSYSSSSVYEDDLLANSGLAIVMPSKYIIQLLTKNNIPSQ